ncbi:hypothetical protein [Microbacterium hydrocarbonoxydans]|uniref:Uncharacterized protein n=1 Tax=Microbacterium hydrocarbonoxydans TaxID=273678 RepID=A0A1H4NPH1_9MICO|nr:hypothetical protein [Microbacterium hydrocarbonoxydans]SEB97156.1 hypothetical protein SAMN04489807_2542 [Microbacterium hydrocarbonoxydans]
MTQTPDAATADRGAFTSRPSRRATIGLWIGAAALLLSAGLIVQFLPVPALLVAAAAAALVAGTAVVLGVRGRRSSVPRTGTAALLVAATALIVDVILIVVIAVGALGGSGLSQVEVRATGGPVFTVSYADDAQSYDEEWSDSGWKQYTTTGDTAEITVTASDDDAVATVSCEILWNGESVVEQSGVGSVTCRYDAN